MLALKRLAVVVGVLMMHAGFAAWGAWAAPDNVLWFGGSGYAPGRQALASDAVPPPAPFVLTGKDPMRAVFVSASDWCWVDTQSMADGNGYSVLDLPGLASGGPIGLPRLPNHGSFVQVPDGAEVRLVIDDVQWVDLPGAFVVAPVQPAPFDSATEALPFAKDAAAYVSDAWYPEAPVRMTERVRVRGRDLVYIVYTPVAFKASSSALRAASRVTWHLEFELPPGALAAPRPDPLGTAAFASFFDAAIDTTTPQTSVAAGLVPLDETGADYLIIVADAFVNSIAPLADLKRQMGLTTRVVPLSSIGASPDANDITDYIRNAYTTWSPRPTYLLLVGDSDDLPPHDERTHPTRPGMPATDLNYLTVDGTDIFPDLFGGRISCSTAGECATIVNKIVTHQISPNTSATYRNSALSMGFFQDLTYGENGLVAPADGIEDRLFMETAEAHKNFFETMGRTVHTAYTKNSSFTPRKYNAESILHLNQSTYIGTQTYREDNLAARTEVLNRINQGVSFAWYRSHGSWAGWDGLDIGNMNDLVNGTKLPVVLSVTCQTGWFDWPDDDCLCEQLMSRSGGGAVAVVGSTRNSMSWWNDWFLHGMFESFWPDYLETLAGITGYRASLSYGNNPVGRSHRLGQALNFAKRVMFEKEAGGSQHSARGQYEILMLFGDPHQSLEPWNDDTMQVSHPALLSAVLAEFTVTVKDALAAPVAGAAVRLTSTAGDDYSAVTDASGQANFVTEPVAVDFLSVAVTKAGMIPYEGRIDLAVLPMTVSHPASVSAVTGGFVVRAYDGVGAGLPGALVTVTSAAGDQASQTTDFSGQAVFAFIPLSITSLDLTVTKRAYMTYEGSIQMIPGTMTVQHATQVDETCGPFAVTVRTGGQPLQAATVLLESTTGSYGQRVTDVNGVVVFPDVPAGPDELTVRTQCRGYTPVDTTAAVVYGKFVWDPLPASFDLGGPEPVRIRLISRIDGTSVVTGYFGTAELVSNGNPEEPPPVVISGVRRYDQHSNILLQQAGGTNDVDLHGWMLVKNGSAATINAVAAEIKDPAASLSPLEHIYFRTTPYTTVDAPDYWGAVSNWNSSDPGWVMLLDAQTNLVDFVAWGWDAEELAAMAPVIRGRTVVLGAHWNGDGVAIGNQFVSLGRKVSSVPQDHNVAEDFAVSTSATLPSLSSVPFVPYGPALDTDPTVLGPFTAGIWTGTVTLLDLASNVLLRAEEGARSGDSERFDIVQAPHAQYAFDAMVNTQKLWNVPFGVTIRAQDRNGTAYTNFDGDARLYGYADAPAPPVLITEIGLTEEAYVEIQNVSTLAADVTGWQLLVGDDPTNINRVTGTRTALAGSLASRGLVSFIEGRPRPPNPALPNLAWSPTEPGWAMLLDENADIVDFVAWGWDASAITNLEVLVDQHPVRVGAAWVGDGAAMPWRSMRGSLQRRGSIDHNRSDDFAWWFLSSRGEQNDGLTLPLTQSRRPVGLSPSGTEAFVAGVWTGLVTVAEDVDAMYLEVVDALGNRGESQRFNVRYLGPITVTLPTLVREGDGTLTGQGQVRVEQAPVLNLIINLSSSDTSELTVPGSVTILGGTTSRTFNLSVLDDHVVDFAQAVEVHAQVGGYGEGSAVIYVQDNDAGPVTLQVPLNTHEGVGVLRNMGRVALASNATESNRFSLVSSVPSLLQVPSAVTVTQGTSNVWFNVALVDNATPEATRTVLVTLAQGDVVYATSTVTVADNDAHHFAFLDFGSLQTARVPFQVTIEARNQANQPMGYYRGTPALSGRSGAVPVAMTPSNTGRFAGGVWTGAISVLELQTGVVLVASDTVAEGGSDAFDVTHGPVTHFAWTQVPTSTVHAGAWLPVRLQACDTNGFPVASYTGRPLIVGTQHDPAYPVRLLTFVRHARMDQGYRHARAALDAHFTNVAETLSYATDPFELAPQLDLHDVLMIVPQEDAPAGAMEALGTAWTPLLGAFVDRGGVVIVCNGQRDEHLLLSNAGLADLMLESVGTKDTPFCALNTVSTNKLTAGVAPLFTGIDVVGFSTTNGDVTVRSASNGVPVVVSRVRGDGHVIMIGSDYAAPNADLDRLLANAVRLGLRRAPRQVDFRPAQVDGFVDGVWTGIVQVGVDGLDTEMMIDDENGHRGSTEHFDIRPLGLTGVRQVPGAGIVFEWASDGVTPYILLWGQGDPDGPYEPVKEGLPATPPINSYTGQLDGINGFYRLAIPPK